MAKYSCKNGSCVEDVNGRFTDSNCGGTCSSSSTKKYACKNGSCVEDVNGRFTDSNCGGTCSSNTYDLCKREIKYRTDREWKRVSKEQHDISSADKFDKNEYTCKANNKIIYFVKKKTTTTPDPVVITPGGRYRDCTGGSYSKGCTDTEGIIKKVQGCLGTTVDGQFWSKTEDALMSKTGKKTFTKEDVSKICSGTSPEGEQQKPFGIDEQKAYWKDLIDTRRITTYGTILTNIDDKKTYYVYKKNRTTDKKEKITRNEVNWVSPEIKDELLKSFETYDYIVLHTINPNTPDIPGQVSILTAGFDDNDNVDILTINAGRWAPSQKTVSYDSDDLVTETIKKILKRRISEQVVTLTKHSSPDPTIKGTDIASTSTKGGGTGTSTTTTKSTTTPKTIDVKVETEKIMTPKKDELNQLMDKLIKYTSSKRLDIAKTQKIAEFTKNKNLLEGMLPEEVCNVNNQKKLKLVLDDFDKQMNNYDAVLDETEESYLNQIKKILITIPKECVRIDKVVSDSVESQGKQSIGQALPDKSVSSPESTSVSGPKPESTATSELKKEEESKPDCSNSVTMLVDYLISGLQDVTTDQTKIDKQKSDLCYCHRTGGFNSMNARTKVGDIFKDKIKSYDLKSDFKTKVAPDKQLFRPLINRNLGWNEIQRLIQGKPVFNVTINSRYIDRNFGTENCYRAVNESINSKVKRHMTEAIKTKRKDVMVESILKDIKGLRK